MPSARHQASSYSLHEQPEVAMGLLTATGVPLPSYDRLQVESPKLPNLVPTDYEADAVITLIRGNRAVLSLILEVQLQWDRHKVWVWPAYIGNLRRRRKCDVHLVVICFSERTAARCAWPIALGHPGFVLHPVVIGPKDIPLVTEIDRARMQPALAVLSALAHPRDQDVLAVLPDALLFSHLNREVYRSYYLLVTAAMPAASRRLLEERMKSAPYVSEFAAMHEAMGEAKGEARGEARGEAKGLAEAVLALLDERGIRLGDAARQRIADCRDKNQLLTWLRRAAWASTEEALVV
jgi:hypothetical protein